MPFWGTLGKIETLSTRTPRSISDGDFTVTAQSDPLLEALPGDGLYRHAATGIICVADARIDAAPDSAPHDTSAAIFAHAYLKSGRDFLRPILGEFSGVLWDPRHRRLVLFTDRIGSRSAFFRHDAQGTRFASDMRQMTLPRTGACDFDKLLTWSLNSMSGDLAGGGICEWVQGGHVAVIESGTVTRHRYWNPEDAPDIRFRTSEEYVDAAEALLEEVVRCRLPRRLNVGSHLSSGLDSPLIAGTAAGVLAKSNRSLTTFTSTHTEPEMAEVWKSQLWDEHRPAADFAARFSNIIHVQVSNESPGLMDGLDSMLSTIGAPPRSALSAWANRHALADEARRRQIGVMFTGACGNETYSQPGMVVLSWLLRRGRLPSLARHAMAMRRQGRPWKKIAGAAIGPLLPPSLLHHLLAGSGVPLPVSLLDILPLAKDVRAAIPAGQEFGDWSGLSRWPMPRHVAAKVSQSTFCEVADWYRNAFGFIFSSPFADSRIIEFCAGLPPDQFCGEGEDRWLARRLLRRMGAPDSITRERGRGIQWANWHSAMMRGRGELYRSLATLEGNATARRLLDLAEMRRLLDELPSANPVSRTDVVKYGNRLSVGLSMGHLVLHLEGSNAGPPLDADP